MHKPVLLTETMELMGVREGGSYIDATVGLGGHAQALLERMGERGRLLGIDRDDQALSQATERLSAWKGQCRLEHGNFSDLKAIVERWGIERVDGVLFDLGVSSYQFDEPERGFSIQHDGPLDMRMDRSQSLTAADLVNTMKEQDLADLIWSLGEERASRRVARWIVRERDRQRIGTTGQLADLVLRAKGGRRGRIHPATQTFQALRMAVNRELENLGAGLEAALELVKNGGRIAAITFHSLEDRVVKHFFAKHEGRWASLPAGGREWVGSLPRVRRINRKPVTAGVEEVEQNPRARSAKLRVVEKVD